MRMCAAVLLNRRGRYAECPTRPAKTEGGPRKGVVCPRDLKMLPPAAVYCGLEGSWGCPCALRLVR